jgi:hypothetical protein
MGEAWQTPHGARPNREGIEDGASHFQRVPARRAKLPGRSLEPFSNGRPRGMTVTAAMPYRIRLTGPISLVAPTIGNDCGGFQNLGSTPWQVFALPIPRDVGDSGDRRAWRATPPAFFHFCCKQRYLAESTLGPPLRRAWVALAWPLGGPRVTQSQTQSQTQSAEGRNV